MRDTQEQPGRAGRRRVRQIRSATRLAEALAERARRLRPLALAELRRDGSPLAALYRAFDGSLRTTTPEDFADACAQTITCGLLVARWLARGAERPFSRALALEEYVPRSSRLLGQLFACVWGAPGDSALARALDGVVELLARAPVDVALAQTREPSNHFFERFLAVYDRDARRARGVYYTPAELVEYMVTRAERALAEDRLGLRLGDDALRVVDPATGAGAFLHAVVQRCAETRSREAAATCLRRACGMEVMLAPYAICHLRLSLLDRGDERGPLAIALTDALAPPRPRAEPGPEPDAVAHEVALADALKRDDRYTLVIGNPPYKNNSAETLAQMAARFPALLDSSRAAARAQQRTIRDDYAWFFAAAEALTRGGGVVCFVTSDSYLKKASYRRFREELLKRFQIVEITRLGAGVFAGVGPRIGFAVITMIRRREPLASADEAAPFRLVELAALAKGTPRREQGTCADPRLVWMAARARAAATSASAAVGAGVEAALVRPSARGQYRLLPGREEGVATGALRFQIVAKGPGDRFQSLFLKKWPGMITAFDRLLKDRRAVDLAARMRRFFALARAGPGADAQRAFAAALGCSERERERLSFLLEQARSAGLSFQRARLRPVFAGSVALGHEWYPPIRYAGWVYYEPRLKIPRNTHPGKRSGWGWMQQWRPEETHLQFPKLIFTTSSNPRYGFRAYVVEEGWFTKLDGAASQKYHYATLHDPTRPARAGGAPNNLSDAGLRALRAVRRAGLEEVDLLHALAAIYNSTYGLSYAAREAELMLPLPDLARAGEETLQALTADARRLRRGWARLQPACEEPFPPPPEAAARGVEAERVAAALEEAQSRVDALVSGLVGGAVRG